MSNHFLSLWLCSKYILIFSSIVILPFYLRVIWYYIIIFYYPLCSKSIRCTSYEIYWNRNGQFMTATAIQMKNSEITKQSNRNCRMKLELENVIENGKSVFCFSFFFSLYIVLLVVSFKSIGKWKWSTWKWHFIPIVEMEYWIDSAHCICNVFYLLYLDLVFVSNSNVWFIYYSLNLIYILVQYRLTNCFSLIANRFKFINENFKVILWTIYSRNVNCIVGKYNVSFSLYNHIWSF